MNIIICVESSNARGMGHLYRSLLLADGLAKEHKILYVVNKNEITKQILTQKNFKFKFQNLLDQETNWEKELIISNQIDLWINDRLNTSIKHSKKVKRCNIKLVNFDDNGSGANLADLNILGLHFLEKDNEIKQNSIYGTDYLILNPDIKKYRRVREFVDPVIVNLGGSDTWGVTIKIINILKIKKIKATIKIGPEFKFFEKLNSTITEDFKIISYVDSMAKEMSKYNLAITGGGITPFEANASGLPCILIANETFEIPVCKRLEKLGGSIFAGFRDEINYDIFSKKLDINLMSKKGIKNISLNGLNKITYKINSIF